MKIRIRKGTDEIGGSCIELSTNNTTILLDYGTALGKGSKTLTLDKHVDAILISHPHQDHFGEITHIDTDIPVYCGERSFHLMNAARIFTGKSKLGNKAMFFEAWKEFTLGDFTIKPFLVDHSAMDAYGFLIKANGKSLFYTGDFRANGRKAKLFDNKCHDKELQNLDALIMEGTMMQRSNLEFENEDSVEGKIHEVLTSNDNLSFLICSSQNIDRIVSAYKACNEAKKLFAIDLYTAWILDIASREINIKPSIPNISWDNIKVIKNFGGSYYEKMKADPTYFGDFLKKVFKDTVSLDDIKQNPANYFIKISPSHIKRLTNKIEIQNFNVIYSQWLGYLSEEFSQSNTVECFKDLQESSSWFYAHTSGHADLESLKTFTSALKPKKLIPIHTEFKKDFSKHFEDVVVLDDGEEYEVV